MDDSVDARLVAIAIIELIGRPISTSTFDELSALLTSTPSVRIILQLAGMIRTYLEANGTPVPKWCDEWRKQSLRNGMGMA